MILISSNNVSDIAKAVQAQLSEWAYMSSYDIAVTRSEVINRDSSKAPWIGIYRQQQSFEPRTLSFGTGFRRQNVTFAIVMQESSTSGTDCEERMERLIAETMSALLSDETVRGTCIALAPDPFLITYSNYQVEGTSFYQEAVLSFTVVTQVTAQEV